MNKAYERINWKNYPSEETALNESNLNLMDAALNEVDTRVVTHETTKLDVATANTMVRNISFNERTGIFTITYLNGSTKELDTKLEKIATNFEYDAERQKLILTLVDGSTQEIDISDLITEYEFENSAYINWTVESGAVKAEIIDGSITADKLQPNFLADVTLQAGNAEISARAANQYAQKAKEYADEAKGSAELANTDGIVDIMNQATTTWVMPDYMKNRDEQPYVCGIGTPEENGYSADDYNDENGYDEPYLDVRSGMVYHAIRVKDLPLTYGWVEKEQLASVQKKEEQNAEDIALLKKNEIKSSYLPFSAVANPMQSAQSGWTHYAAITVDYSSLGNVEILQTSLIMLGDDTTQSQQNLPTNVALSAMAMNGNKISRVGAFTNSQKTIRFGISVLYRNK